MKTGNLALAAIAAAGVFLATPLRAQDAEPAGIQSAASAVIATDEAEAAALSKKFMDQECPFFGPERTRFAPRILGTESHGGRLTRQFYLAAPRLGGGDPLFRANSFEAAKTGSGNIIDQAIFAALQANNVTPAQRTTDYEFIRRVTLDLTGRIPTSGVVDNFVSSLDPNKRANVINALIGSPEWVDKWTMYFGDLYGNTASNTQVQIRAEGRNAFYKWIKSSLAANKPYNQMATELITAQGNNSFDQANGQLNYLPLNLVNGGPTQDIFDSQTSAIAVQFLGMAHVNCILCHSGRGHLDSLSLWGSRATRAQAWGQSAFLAHTRTRALPTPKDDKGNSVNYWSLEAYTTDYALNTTTGNRPARAPIGTTKTIAPSYMFGGQTPKSGEDYRVALARFVTGDRQFARAAVNYMWAAFFGKGIVDPVDQFDPARLDPNNPPPAPWTLQPSNPALLEGLTTWFMENNYDLRGLQRLIASSDTYQLASEYRGNWDPAWESLFARKLVRRLWPEEIHDAVITAIGTLPSYTVNGFTLDSTVFGVDSPGFGKINYAMQAPDVINMPDNGGGVSQFLDTFLRGNRYDSPRKTEGSILQALALMNDNFVVSRIHATGSGATATYLTKNLTLPDDALINRLFIDVLSRYPSPDEKTLALTQLQKGGTAATRKANAEDILWTLFNKVDFIFNY